MQNTQSRASERVSSFHWSSPRFVGRVGERFRDGEAWTEFMVLDRAATEAAYVAHSGAAGVCAHNRGEFVEWLAAELDWVAVYRGPGRAFWEDLTARPYGKWLLVTQRGGFDV